MPTDGYYRCYLKDDAGHLIGPAREITAVNEAGAIQEALGLCKSVPEHCAAIELWHGDEVILRHRVKLPPKTPDRAYPLAKNQEYAYAYDWEDRPG